MIPNSRSASCLTGRRFRRGFRQNTFFASETATIRRALNRLELGALEVSIVLEKILTAIDTILLVTSSACEIDCLDFKK